MRGQGVRRDILYFDILAQEIVDDLEAALEQFREIANDSAAEQPVKMNTRAENEKKFGHWDELPGGGRRYWLDVSGRLGWRARYLKEVDAQESTLRFWQEIYDEQEKLVEVHEKYPVDKGHQKV